MNRKIFLYRQNIEHYPKNGLKFEIWVKISDLAIWLEFKTEKNQINLCNKQI